MDRFWVEEAFGLKSGDYSMDSPSTPDYNCIAWAAGKTDQPWWPINLRPYYWPPELIKRETVRSFILAFKLQGYRRCRSGNYETGFEKVAIYATLFGEPKHAARQLGSGVWTSKLGDYQDITHTTCFLLEGDGYGRVVAFLKRCPGTSASPVRKLLIRFEDFFWHRMLWLVFRFF
jgi:hypothetical protein